MRSPVRTLITIFSHAYQRRRALNKISNEDVVGGIKIIQHEISGGAFENDVTAVRRDSRVKGTAVAAMPSRDINTHQARRAVSLVAHENVLHKVVIASRQIASGSLKGNHLTI